MARSAPCSETRHHSHACVSQCERGFFLSLSPVDRTMLQLLLDAAAVAGCERIVGDRAGFAATTFFFPGVAVHCFDLMLTPLMCQ